MADKLPPCVIGMKGVGVVPRIVHDFFAAMIVGTHHKIIVLCKLHKPHRLCLPLFAIRVLAAVWIRIVTVHIDTVGVVTGSTIYGVVAAMIGAVGVGVGSDVKIDVVKDVGALRKGGVLQEVVDEAEHQHPTGSLVAVDGGSVKELRLAGAIAVVDVGDQDLAVAGQGAKLYDLAFVGMVGMEGIHHVFVSAIGRVAVPVVFGTVAAIPHGQFLEHRRRSHQCDFITEFLELAEFVVVGVSDDGVSFNTVNGNGMGNGLKVVIAVQLKSKIVLIALLHELVQFLLALLSEQVAANQDG